MKKILFASTALVAAGMLTAGAASASEKIKLQLGGFSKWYVVGAWNDSSYEAASPGTNDFNSVDVKGDNEIFIGGSTTLDNGLKVGIDVQLEAGGGVDQSSDTIDESYVWISGGFGKVILGSENNGVYLLHVQAPDAAGNWGEGSNSFANGASATDRSATIAQPSGFTALPGGHTTAIATDGDADKITYVAPAFYGLTVGASYIPNATEDTRSATRATEIFGVGALYQETFAGVGVKLSAGYVQGDIDHTTVQSALRQEWSTGLNLSYAGFTLGGSYRNVKDNLEGTLLSGAGAATGGTTDNSGSGWDVGLQYAAGPYAVSVGYFTSSTEGLIATEGEDKFEVYQVSGKYNLGAGVDLVASVAHLEYDGEQTTTSTTDANHNEGWVALSGLVLTF